MAASGHGALVGPGSKDLIIGEPACQFLCTFTMANESTVIQAAIADDEVSDTGLCGCEAGYGAPPEPRTSHPLRSLPTHIKERHPGCRPDDAR